MAHNDKVLDEIFQIQRKKLLPAFEDLQKLIALAAKKYPDKEKELKKMVADELNKYIESL